MIAQFAEGLTLKLYLTQRAQRAQSYILAVNAGAGGVAVARDGERRGGWTENGERKTGLSHTESTESTEMPVLSTLITLALESTELHQLHGVPCGMLKINQHEDEDCLEFRV